MPQRLSSFRLLNPAVPASVNLVWANHNRPEIGSCVIARNPSSLSGVKWKLTFSSFFSPLRWMNPVPVHWVEASPSTRNSVNPARCRSASSVIGVSVRFTSRRPFRWLRCRKPSPWIAQFARSIRRSVEIPERDSSHSSVTCSLRPPLPLSGLLPLYRSTIVGTSKISVPTSPVARYSHCGALGVQINFPPTAEMAASSAGTRSCA